MNSNEPSFETLRPLLDKLNSGKLNETFSISSQLVIDFPKSSILFNIIGACCSGLMKHDDAIVSYKKAIENNPQYADSYYNLGNQLKVLENLDDAIYYYKKAIEINPNYVNAYNNLGNAYIEQGKLDAAIDIFKQTLSINPDNASTYNNLGNAFISNGDLDKAIKNYKKAIEINANDANAFNNLGIALSNKNSVDDAIDCYKRAIEINPNFKKAQLNLIGLLSTYAPINDRKNTIVLANELIRNCYLDDDHSGLITDEKVVSIFSKFKSYVGELHLSLSTNYNQAYRRSTTYLNCKRHKSIFNEFEVIPEFCFGCYKVQVEPKSLINLIKLLIVFDQLTLDNNNTRKCLIELRPEVSGFYKGLIYCSGLEEANEIAKHLNKVILNQIDPKLSCSIKRGCSEFYTSFPEYQEINNFGPQKMNHNEEWREIEENHDKNKTFLAEKIRRQSISGLNLNDFLIIQRWIDYAKGIGDPTVNLFKQNSVIYKKVYEMGKHRLNNYKL